MNHDSFLEIGSQHKVCEDFIISGINPCPYVILSDGCSGSKNSNYGAMILVQMARRYLVGIRNPRFGDIDYDDMGNWIIMCSRPIAALMGLNNSCLDATLIVSYLWNGNVHVYVYGDVCIITKSRSEVFYSTISFSCDAPYYLSYREDDARRWAYEDGGHSKEVKLRSLDGETVYEGTKRFDCSSHYTFNYNLFQEVYIASDGINSFVRNGERLPAGDVIKGFLDIDRENRDEKTKGVFVQRRCRKALKGFKKEGWDHYDDISFGGFLCGIS